jgi:hypothetical protein
LGEDGRLHPRRPHCAREEPCKEKGGGHGRDEGRIAAHEDCESGRDGEAGDGRPYHGLTVGREIQQDADAEAHCRPREEAPMCSLLVEAPQEKGAEFGPREGCRQPGAAPARHVIEHGSISADLAGTFRRHAA